MTTNKDPNAVETYVLLQGKHSGFDENGDAKDFRAGDQVKLTEKQALSFKGKFKSLRQLRAEAKLAEEGYGVDSDTDATSSMIPSKFQPLAPNAPVDEETGKLEDPNQQLAEEINADLAGSAPAAGETVKEDKDAPVQQPAAATSTTATPVKPATQPVKPATTSK